MRSIIKAKPLFLGLLIAVGLIAQGSRAQAATETLIVAGGCFWCVESDFESVQGVKSAVSGYIGGTTKNPSYKEASRGGSGHYEAVKITFDSDVVSRERLLYLFFRSVDPTDDGGQFCDRGESYRTAIFVSNKAEKALAEQAKADAQAALGRNIVTPILPKAKFYKAEAYHQDYYKGDNIVLTRRGPKSQASAYKFYRKSCGRDQKVKSLWGSDAPFVN